MSQRIGTRLLGVALLVGLGFALALQERAIDGQSLIGDAPYHLVAGHQALRYGQNTLNLEHPPLVKLVAALPLLLEEPVAPPSRIDDALTTAHRLFDDPSQLERIRLRSRSLLFLLFGLPLLLSVDGLGRHLVSRRVGHLLSLSLALSFASLPFLSVIQTDTAVALGFVLTLWMALRFVEGPTPGAALALGAGLGLALASKFSALLLLPVVALALGLASGLSFGRRLARAALVLLPAVGLPWASYAVANHAYDSEAGRQTIRAYCQGDALVTEDRLLPWEENLLRLETLSPSLAQYATGVLGVHAQNDLGIYPTLAFGTLSTEGRWWYFPALLLLRTPWVLLLCGVAAAIHRVLAPPRPLPLPAQGPARRARWLLAATAVIYLGVAATSSYNLGVRHLLPVLPLIYLPAVRWAARGAWTSLLLLAILATEGWLLAPLWMSATGSWWLSEDPARLAMVSGDTEYHQNFIALERWAEEQGIDRYALLYPLLSAHEVAAYSERAVVVRPGEELDFEWVVTSILLESHLPAVETSPAEGLRGAEALRELAVAWRPLWNSARQGEDLGPVAGTFRVFHHPRPPD